MTQYKQYPLFDSEKLNQYTEDTGQHYTTNIQEAMHLWPDGRMTSSTYEGIRGDDHQVVLNYFEHTPFPEFMDLSASKGQEIAASSLGVVRMVPETEMALKAENQSLTEEQKQVLHHSSYELADFCPGIELNAKTFQELGIDDPKKRAQIVSREEEKKPLEALDNYKPTYYRSSHSSLER